MNLNYELKVYVKKFNKHIIEYLDQIKPEILKLSSLHLIKSGGKRLRPFILSKVSECYGIEFEKSLPAAISVELIHNFSLIHDDIIDKDKFRHGIKTVHEEYGIPYAILSGDTLFSLAFKSLENLRQNFSLKIINKAYNELSNATYRLAIGQGLDMYLSYNKIFNYNLYIEMIKNKTAALFETSCVIGALLGNAKKYEIFLIRNFAKNAGIAFQIKDDILGVFGDSKITGKPVGSDIKEGKKTLIIIYAMKNSDKKFQKNILKILGNKNVSQDKIRNLIEDLKKIGAYDYAIYKSNEYINKALYFAEKLPGKVKEILTTFSDFLIKRKF